MARLFYSVDLSAPSLELAAQALTVARVQEFAHLKDLEVEETAPEGATRDFILLIPTGQLEDTILELKQQGLARIRQTLVVSLSVHANLPQHILDFFTIEDE